MNSDIKCLKCFVVDDDDNGMAQVLTIIARAHFVLKHMNEKKKTLFRQMHKHTFNSIRFDGNSSCYYITYNIHLVAFTLLLYFTV